jgi:uncharacterized membrane-anchored protein
MHKQFLIALCCFAFALPRVQAQEKTGPKLNVIHGPAKAQMAGIAQIELPGGYSFIDGAGTRALMKRSGEPVSGNEMGLIAPTNEHWSVIFEFSNVGYVKDDDKDKLNADKILADIKEGTAEANKERIKAGGSPLEIVGWEQPPKYNPETHNLEWAIRATSDGQPLLNYNTRLLGRKGVMEVVLVVEPDDLQATLPKFKDLLANYTFSTGQSYAEYRSGDKVAKYGLAALVVGGAAVGAAKLGLLGPVILLFKKAWKLVVVAFAAVVGFFKKMFNKVTGRDKETTPRM